MNDWVPVLIVALVVVCVTAYLLLDPKFRRSKRRKPLGPVPFTGLRAARWCAERLSKKGPASGGGAQGGQSETLEGSCLTFTPNTTALHRFQSRGRASFAKTRAPY